MSVGALVLSPLTKGLFKRAIMQSGSPNSYLGSNPENVTLLKTHHFAQSMNCSQTAMTDILACLRNKSVDDILHLSKFATTNGEAFDPIYGDEVMPIKPYDALKTGHFNQNIELLFGTVKDEGSIFIEEIFSDLAPDKHTVLTVSKTKSYISLIFMMLKQSYSQSIADFYTAGLKDTDNTELIQAISNSFGDYQLTCPTVLYGSTFAAWSKANKAYAYRVTHPPTLHAFPRCKVCKLISIFNCD